MASAASGAATIQQVVAAAVGDESVQTVLYREERGSLNDSSTIWREYASISELPAEPLVGWEELIVFTERYVHRWVETGYGGNPTTVPRDPDSVVPEPNLGLGD